MIAGLELFKGDIHRGGKFVISVTFEEGSILYFKPRDSYNELFFHAYIVINSGKRKSTQY